MKIVTAHNARIEATKIPKDAQIISRNNEIVQCTLT